MASDNSEIAVLCFRKDAKSDNPLLSILTSSAVNGEVSDYYFPVELSKTGKTLEELKNTFDGQTIPVNLYDFPVSEVVENSDIIGLKVDGDNDLQPITIFHRAWMEDNKKACLDRLKAQVAMQIKNKKLTPVFAEEKEA